VCQAPLGKTPVTTSECGAAASTTLTTPNYSDDVNSRCCKLTPWDTKTYPNSVCVKGNAAHVTHPTAAQASLLTATNYQYNGDVDCGPDPTFTQHQCGVDKTKAPTALADCARDLSTKCCFGTTAAVVGPPAVPATATCIVASNANRAGDAASAVTWITNQYLDLLTGVSCEDNKTPLPTNNQCGYDGKATLNGTATNVTDKANCTTGDNSKQYCCYAKGAAAVTPNARCVTLGTLRSSLNATDPTVKTTEQGKLADLYADLSDVECSSSFVSAGIAIIAVVLALF